MTLIISPDTTLRLPDVRDAIARPSAPSWRHCTTRTRSSSTTATSTASRCGSRRSAHRLFGLSMDELTNRVVELDDLLGRGAEELVGGLWDVAGWEARFDLLDRLIGARG